MSPRQRFPVGLVIAIAAYVALRAAILWTNFDATALPMFELYPMGTLAELQLRGIDFPIRYFYDNAAGQILMGYLVIPFFWVFGSSYLVLKLLPATIGLATLVLLWRFLDQHFSRRAANLGAWLFAVGPPTLVKYSVICSGNHFENLFFTLLAIACFYRCHGGRPTFRALFLAAFTAGFAVFVFLGSIIPVGILLGLHLGLRGIRQALRDGAALLPGFLVGFAPLLLVNLATGGRGLGFLDAKFGAESSGRSGAVLERMGDFLGPQLLKSGVFEPFLGLSGAMWSVFFVAAFALAYLASLPSASSGIGMLLRGLVQPQGDARTAFERVKLVPFVLYVPLAALAYGLSNFRLGGDYGLVDVAGYRYYLPTLLCALVLLAVWSARWWERGGSQRAAGAVLAATSLLCGLTSLSAIDPKGEFAGVGPHYDGYNLAQIARALLSTRNAVPHEEVVSIVESLPPDVRQRVVTAIGFNIGVREIERQKHDGQQPLDVLQLTSAYPEVWVGSMAVGMENAIRWMQRMGTPVEDRLNWGSLGHWPRPLPCVGIGTLSPGVGLPLASELPVILAENRAILEATQVFDPGAVVPAAGWVPKFDGLKLYAHGFVLGRMWMRGSLPDLRMVRAEIAQLTADPRFDPIFWFGFGIGLVWNTDTRAIPPDTWAMPRGELAAAWLGQGLARALLAIDPSHAETFLDLEREGAPQPVLQSFHAYLQVASRENPLRQ